MFGTSMIIVTLEYIYTMKIYFVVLAVTFVFGKIWYLVASPIQLL